MNKKYRTVGDVFDAASDDIKMIEHDIVCVLVQDKEGNISTLMSGGKFDGVGNLLAKVHQNLIRNSHAREGKKIRLVE